MHTKRLNNEWPTNCTIESQISKFTSYKHLIKKNLKASIILPNDTPAKCGEVLLGQDAVDYGEINGKLKTIKLILSIREGIK